MKLSFAVPLVPLLLLAAPVSAQLPDASATAAGTASFLVTHASTGETLCAGSAAFAVEIAALGMTADGGVGAAAWDAPNCATPGASGAAAFTTWCTDACFDDCVFVTPDEVSCWSDFSNPDGSWGEDTLTLRRDGSFAFHRAGRELGTPFDARAQGVLLVATWPDPSWA